MSIQKPRVVFPFVEAGFGHIMAERSIADAFEKKYGEYFEVVRSDFFKESGSKPMQKYEKSDVGKDSSCLKDRGK